MTNRSNPNTNELAETIRRRLERSAEAAQAEPSAEPTGRLRATKDGQILAPGESAPTGPDGKPTPTLVVPDATFHERKAVVKQVVLMSKRVASEIREACRSMRDEDGGALFGSPEHGDVIAQVRAPSHAERSSVMIRLRGYELEGEAKRVLASHAAAGWVGGWHLHFDLDRLSAGDVEQIAKLHGDSRIPSCGFVKVLAVKRGTAPVELKGFISPEKGVVNEVDLFEVDDVIGARTMIRSAVTAPTVSYEHILGTRPGARRFAGELAALEADGYEVTCDVAPQGVALTLRHAELHGDLALVLPREGWERPPRVEHRLNGTAKMLTSPLTTLLSAWSSAHTLSDLVAAARARSAWPKKPAPRAVQARKGAA